MGINTALVDRARQVTKVSTGVKVEGSTRFVDTIGTWFRVRLALADDTEAKDPGDSVRRSPRSSSVMVAFRDDQGVPVAITANDVLEIESEEQGQPSFWEASGPPKPIRKKRSVIGYTVKVKRLEDFAEVKYGVKSGCDEYFYLRDLSKELSELELKEACSKHGLKVSNLSKSALLKDGNGEVHVIERAYLRPIA